jgi:hypothetical protein
MNESHMSRTWQYGLEIYGRDVVYDDFIANFTVDKFDPKEWVDLIADAGAKYFVPTTKHHDGYALFSMPSTVSDRNSVKQFPHRDLLKVRSCSNSLAFGRITHGCPCRSSLTQPKVINPNSFEARTSACRNGSIRRTPSMVMAPNGDPVSSNVRHLQRMTWPLQSDS